MKFAMLVIACVLIPPMILSAMHGAQTPTTAPSQPLTIAQQAGADKAAARAVDELEAANIEGAFNRALRDVGSRTQLHDTLSFAKWLCFDRRKTAREIIDCAHNQADTHPGIELTVFARMP